MIRERAARRAAAALCAAAALVGAPADAADGLYAGALDCQALPGSAAVRMDIVAALRDGRATWASGSPGTDGYNESALALAADGTVTVTGHYLVGSERKPLALAGRIDDRRIVASGRRGPRDCRLSLARPGPSGAQPPYRLPYDPAAVRAAAAPAKPRPCPAPIAPLRDVIVEPFYRAGGHYSEVDPERMASYRRALEPLRAYESAVSTQADQAMRRVPGAAACVLALLDTWAEAEALLGTVTSQGGYERKWSSIAFALAFIENRDAATPAQALRIARWLRAIGDRVAQYYMRPPRPGLSDKANNHAYWAALATSVAGIAAGDRDLLDWGLTRFAAALGDVDADGFLERELMRGSKALHYHRFSIEPLLFLALVARANAVAVAPDGQAALDRLIARVRAGLDDPAPFQARTGQAQDFVGGQDGTRAIGRNDWSWAELALALRPDAALEARVAPQRPFAVRWLGGDLTLRYARR
ncbi:MAG: alginate lyase family protein [Alphaproteobacteria bacterium]|nr:alginate lyase family protein [Alphaproteobacteria bacterium]